MHYNNYYKNKEVYFLVLKKLSYIKKNEIIYKENDES